jgi:Skp family chaperone for outer membrane proteins
MEEHDVAGKPGFLSVAVLLAVAGAAAAQTAVIDDEAVLGRSMRGRQVKEYMAKVQQEKMQEVNARQTELQAKRDRLLSQGLTLNDQAKAKLSAEIEQGEIELKRMREDKTREYNQVLEEQLLKLNEEIDPVLQQLAREKGLKLILSRTLYGRGLLYFDASIDLTDELIRRFDEVAQAQPATASPPPPGN